MHVFLLGLAAALGTLTGLFVGMPAVGFVLWPLTRTLCRTLDIEIDPTDEHDRVMLLEGSLAAGLGMALGITVTVGVIGLLSVAPQVFAPALAAGLVGGLTFGSLWHHGYARHSAAPLVLVTALLSALSAGFIAAG
ncbi:MAG: hypothetical protein AAGF11_11520 [Myxococcota bacterium]